MGKTTALTFRMKSELIKALCTVAEQGYCSTANKVAVLIVDYYERNDIAIERIEQIENGVLRSGC